MLRFVGGFFQNNLSQAQQHTVLLHFPSGTFGLRFRRNFCFDINFAIHIQNPEAKWKITCQFSFLFGALLSCSNVTTKMLWACGKKTGGGGGGAEGESIECTKPVTLPTQPRVPTVYSGVLMFSSGTESTAFPSNTHILLSSLTHEAT